ncbi:MAG: MerR family transcriptional regulator [Polyangiaceae bacterium]|nr:MerR family transcriptional regulator [Polyangiaceae bacterium]
MRDRTTQKRRWRVGELAEATGLTVRTLHHYDQIGLLSAGGRTRGRQRLYDERDVRRLYRIVALRDLGLSLVDVARVLKDDRTTLADVLRAHRARIDEEIAHLRKLRRMLDHAATHAGDDVATEQVLATIEAMSRVARQSEAPKTSGAKTTDAVKAEWRKLGAELRRCMKADEPPSSPRARAVARAAQEQLHAFAGGDRATLDALAHLRRFAPPKSFGGWTAAMFGYLDQALASLSKKEKKA